MRTFLFRLNVNLAMCLMVFVMFQPTALAAESHAGYRIVFVSQISSNSERRRIISLGTVDRMSSIQRELAGDPVFIGVLRSRGVRLHHVIGSQRTGNGRVIVYMR